MQHKDLFKIIMGIRFVKKMEGILSSLNFNHSFILLAS